MKEYLNGIKQIIMTQGFATNIFDNITKVADIDGIGVILRWVSLNSVPVSTQSNTNNEVGFNVLVCRNKDDIADMQDEVSYLVKKLTTPSEYDAYKPNTSTVTGVRVSVSYGAEHNESITTYYYSIDLTISEYQI